jgi:hypothetical protein
MGRCSKQVGWVERSDTHQPSRAELPRFARVTFFGAKKVTKENTQCRGKSAVGEVAGIFRCGILPRRKTVRVLRTALRVYHLEWGRAR